MQRLCVNAETAWCNPQYHLVVTDVDDNDDERLGTVIVSLMQKGTRQLRQHGQSNLTIGYEIFPVGSQLSSYH